MFSLSRSCALLAVLLVGSTVGPSPLFAQEAATPPLGTAALAEVASAPAAPVAKDAPALPLGVRAASPFLVNSLSDSFRLQSDELAPSFEVLAVQNRVRPPSNIAMIGLGGAAIVVGLIVGGDSGNAIAATGAVIGLIGLYRYMN